MVVVMVVVVVVVARVPADLFERQRLRRCRLLQMRILHPTMVALDVLSSVRHEDDFLAQDDRVIVVLHRFVSKAASSQPPDFVVSAALFSAPKEPLVYTGGSERLGIHGDSGGRATRPYLFSSAPGRCW